MLSKVNKDNVFLGTDALKEFYKIKKFDLAQDNLESIIIYKKNDKVLIYNYKLKKYYNHNKIQLKINGKIIIKQIDSFDQNNILISNKIRKYVINLCSFYKSIETILGIGGEFYVYFPFVNAKKYYGISNHQSIITDANYNIPWSNNYLVDYNNLEHSNKFKLPNKVNIIILNVYNICASIINYIDSIDFDYIIIIACKIPNNKLKDLTSHIKIYSIKHILNINSWISIIDGYKYVKN